MVPESLHRHATKNTGEDEPEAVGDDEGEHNVEEFAHSRRAEDADVEAEDGDFGKCKAGYVGHATKEEELEGIREDACTSRKGQGGFTFR